MAKENIIMNEKDFIEWSKKVILDNGMNGNGGQQIVDYIRKVTCKLDKLTETTGDLPDFTDDDFCVLAHFANITRAAAMFKQISKDEAAELNAIQLALLFAKPLNLPARAIAILDAKFLEVVAEGIHKETVGKGGE